MIRKVLAVIVLAASVVTSCATPAPAQPRGTLNVCP